MADYDSNLIKPVNGLKNIIGLDPVKRREERRRRQQLHHEKEEKEQTMQDEETMPEDKTGSESDIDPDTVGIDYCA